MSIMFLYLVFAMLAVLWFDLTRYIIPNWLVASLIVLYPLAVMMAPEAVDWQMALVGVLLVFAVGYVVFARGWMGGGDIKLITACSLWVGWELLLEYIFLTALLGGVFAVLVWVIRKILPHVPMKSGKPLPRILRDAEPVPYGVAIALAMLMMAGSEKIAVI